MDWRWTDKGPDGDALPISVAGAELPAEARALVARELVTRSASGQWHRALVRIRGGRLSLTLDGVDVFADIPLAGGKSAPVGLRQTGRPMEFANIFVRE